jgi:hypothetical protein
MPTSPTPPMLTRRMTVFRYVDELHSTEDSESGGGAVASGPLMCLVEQLAGGMGKDERVRLGMITISPSTGDVVWDEFDGEYQSWDSDCDHQLDANIYFILIRYAHAARD